MAPGLPADAITVDVTRNPTLLTGTLQTDSAAITPEFFLVAFSTVREFWQNPTRRVAITRSDSTGHFTIHGLPPGKYYLAVTSDLAETDLDKPEVFDGLVTGAVTVTLESGKTTRQDLRVK